MSNIQKIIKTLEEGGKSPYYIIGHLQGELQYLEMTYPAVEGHLKQAVNFAERIVQMHKEEAAKIA